MKFLEMALPRCLSSTDEFDDNGFFQGICNLYDFYQIHISTLIGYLHNNYPINNSSLVKRIKVIFFYLITLDYQFYKVTCTQTPERRREKTRSSNNNKNTKKANLLNQNWTNGKLLVARITNNLNDHLINDYLLWPGADAEIQQSMVQSTIAEA